mmetsp:Transcript_11312/g.16756  ORF Transcript_11312/g.16756 Transcript_11312/m.16756 type:complete len:278 (-) Transcript_11312:63-896(-)
MEGKRNRRMRSNTISGGGIQHKNKGYPTITKINSPKSPQTPKLARGESQGMIKITTEYIQQQQQTTSNISTTTNTQIMNIQKEKERIRNMQWKKKNRMNLKNLIIATKDPEEIMDKQEVQQQSSTYTAKLTPETPKRTHQQQQENKRYKIIGYNTSSPHSTKNRKFKDEIDHLKTTIQELIFELSEKNEKIEKKKDNLYWAADMVMKKKKEQEEEMKKQEEAYEAMKERLKALTKELAEQKKKKKKRLETSPRTLSSPPPSYISRTESNYDDIISVF